MCKLQKLSNGEKLNKHETTEQIEEQTKSKEEAKKKQAIANMSANYQLVNWNEVS